MARVTQPYKRSFSSSLGSGFGSVFGGSGRQYFILEHKSGSRYHRAGESQEIIVDQIEIGRDPKCQVRFDESFTTVSRRHAAIVRSGERWKLIQLSTTNPTFLNGAKVDSEWYLQNGDEIQFSVGGPKLGFIIPSGNKASVGNIGLTRRLSLFRNQALRPYKQAITLLSVALILLLAGSVWWGVYSHQSQGSLIAKNMELALTLEETNKRADQLADESNVNKEEVEALRKKAESLAEEINQNNQEIKDSRSEMNALLKRVVSTNTVSTGNIPASSPSSSVAPSSVAPSSSATTAATNSGNANTMPDGDITKCNPHVFAIVLESIVVTLPEGDIHTLTPKEPYSVCGTGFLLNDGRFVSARHVLEPWYYYEYLQDPMYEEFNKLINNQTVQGTAEVVAYFNASSSTGKRFSFNSKYLKCNRTTDKIESIRVPINDSQGNKTSETIRIVKKAILDENDWAYLQTNETAGLSFNNSLSNNLQVGAELEILGFPQGRGAESIQITPIYSKCNVARAGINVDGTIIVSNNNTESGNSGGPVLIKNDGAYQVIGVVSGRNFEKGRVVPISGVQ